MFNKIIDWSVNNRLLILIALFASIVGAIMVIPKLNLDAFPDVTNVQVAVNTEAPDWQRKKLNNLLLIRQKL